MNQHFQSSCPQTRQIVRREFVKLELDGISVRLATTWRDGNRDPIVFLHGFGSSREDYADVLCRPEFDEHAILAFDAPGCGESECPDLSTVSISWYREATKRLIDHYSLSRFHLVGHSMGGIAALLLVHSNPDPILSFTNIEGNLAPEDCFWSRQAVRHGEDKGERFLDVFIERTRNEVSISGSLVAVGIRQNVRSYAAKPLLRSIVELSDNADLLCKFIELPIPRMFMYGDANNSLSYLGELQRSGVQLSEISECGHFPMYANPPEMWGNLKSFLRRVESRRSNGGS